MVGGHINDSNRNIWDSFVQKAEDMGLSQSMALQQAAMTWLQSHGVWLFNDPAPVPTRRVTPLCSCHPPEDVPQDLVAYYDRYLCPPRIVIPKDGTDD